MKNFCTILALAAGLFWLPGCATSSVKKSWKAPGYQAGAVARVGILAVDDRGMVRKGMENRFLHEFEQRGQPAAVTHELLSLPEIKADKVAAAKKLTDAGVDSVLLIRFIDQITKSHSVRASDERYSSMISDINYEYGWYAYYSVAFMDMGTVWSSTTTELFLDACLFDLKSGKPIWSTLTSIKLKENADRLEAADDFATQVVRSMAKSGMVK